jgi:hypothetical protein
MTHAATIGLLKPLKGEQSYLSVLTYDKVLEIRKESIIPRSRINGYSAIARKYEVDHNTIKNICVGKTWVK